MINEMEDWVALAEYADGTKETRTAEFLCDLVFEIEEVQGMKFTVYHRDHYLAERVWAGKDKP